MNLTHAKKHLLFLLIILGIFGLDFNSASGKEVSTLEPWLKTLRTEALVRNISKITFDKAFTGFVPIKRIIELDRKQPEFSMTFKKYLNHVIPKSRIKRGKIKYR